MTSPPSTIPLARLGADEIARINPAIEALGPREILRWAVETFDHLAALSAFQKAGCVLCHLIAEERLQSRIDVVFVDTGVNFQETLDTVGKLRNTYSLNVVTLRPDRTMAEQTRDEGVLYLTREGQERCCALRKKEPLRKIRGRYEALLASLYRGEGGRRARVPALALDTELNLVRVHPLVRMTADEIEAKIRAHSIPYNPLHDQGYPTVSCNRCTSPVLPGEDERAGRWRHLPDSSKYCNINPTDRTADRAADRPAQRNPNGALDNGIISKTATSAPFGGLQADPNDSRDPSAIHAVGSEVEAEPFVELPAEVVRRLQRLPGHLSSG